MLHVIGHGVQGHGSVRSKVMLPGGSLTAHAMAKLLEKSTECSLSLVYLDCCHSSSVLDDLQTSHPEVARSAAWIVWKSEALDHAAFLFSCGVYASLAASRCFDHASIRSAFRSGQAEMEACYTLTYPDIDITSRPAAQNGNGTVEHSGGENHSKLPGGGIPFSFCHALDTNEISDAPDARSSAEAV